MLYELGGRGRLRVREVYLRDHVLPLISHGASGVLKLDLALRCLAALGDDPGLIPASLSWEQLHDLCRPRGFYAEDRKLKRKWVSDKIERLEDANLLERGPARGHRPPLRALRDDGSGQAFDDPGAVGDPYVSFLGDAIQHERIAGWGSSQIAAFFAAMVAERYARADVRLSWLNAERRLGDGIWYRSLDWFADPQGRRPANHIIIPFSTRTLRRGIGLLQEEGLMAATRLSRDPATGQRFRSRYGRVVYFNSFANMRARRPPMSVDWVALSDSPWGALS